VGEVFVKCLYILECYQDDTNVYMGGVTIMG
jgi:hypothetical protein